jgi:hypothetical protein
MVKKTFITLLTFVFVYTMAVPIPVHGATISGDFGTNLSAHWTFDTDGTDSTANNNDLTNNASVSFTCTGARNGCASFVSGTNEYLSITDALQTGLDLDGDFTISFWIDPVADNGTYEGIFSKDTNGANNTRSWLLYYDDRSTTNYFNLALFPTGYSYPGYWAGKYDYNLTEGSFNHSVITCDISEANANKCYLYINGAGQGYFTLYDGTGATSIQDTATAIEIGYDSSGHVQDFDGKLDEFSVWKGRILNSTEVTTLYNSGTPLEYAGTSPVNYGSPKVIWFE